MPQRIPLHHIKLFKPGNAATYNGFPHTISHVAIRGDELFVYFKGSHSPAPANDVSVEVTVIDFNRDNDGPRSWILGQEPPLPEPEWIESDINADLPEGWIL